MQALACEATTIDPVPASAEPLPEAAAAIPPEEAAAPSASASKRERKNKIFGFSACSVVKALGRAGVKWKEADAILRSHGVSMSKASVSVQLGFGRNESVWEKHGKPAELSEEQITELRRSAEGAVFYSIEEVGSEGASTVLVPRV